MKNIVRIVVLTASLWLAEFILNATPLLAQEVLTLPKALQIAIENNFAIKIARNSLIQADNNSQGVMGWGNAGMLPNVNLTGSFTEGNNTATQILNTDTSRTPRQRSGVTDRFAASVQLDWTLFNGLRMFATLDRFKELQARGDFAVKQSLETTIAQVMRSYYDVVQQQATLTALRNALQTSRERLSVAQSKEGIGTSSRLEVMRAQVDMNADSAAVLRQIVVVRNTKAVLQTVLAKQADDNAVERMNVRDSIVIALKSTYNELLGKLKANNIALQDARTAQSVAETSVREAAAVYYPSVNVTANYNLSNTLDATGIFAQNQISGWSFGVSGQWTLFNGLNNVRQVQNASIDALNTQEQYNDLALRLENSLAQAYRSFQNSLELLKLEQENFAIADETERIGLERFKLGALTSLELREIQQNALRAETRLVTVKFEAKAAEIELMRLSGQFVNAPR